jgi:membrane protein HdeD
MSGLVTPPTTAQARHTGYALLLIEGVLLVLLGLGAVIAPLLAGVLAAGILGWLLIIAGIAGLVSTFYNRTHIHFWGALLSSIAALVVGLLIVFDPGAGAVALSWMLAAWLMVDGVSSIVIALSSRKAGTSTWWWLMLSGLLDWVLALFIAFSNPLVGIAVVGTLVGIDLLFGGIALLAMARGLRRGTI